VFVVAEGFSLQGRVYPSLSTIGLLHTIGPERVPHGQNVLAAYDREQTRIAYEEASGIVCADKHIVEATRTLHYRHSIIHRKPRAFLKAVSSDAAAQNGRAPNFVLFDEVHAWRDRKLYDVLRTGLGKTSGTLSIVISQAGRGQENLAHEIFDYARKVASGAIEDAGTLPILFETAADADWQDEDIWLRVNPGLALGYPDLDSLRQEAREAANRPALRDYAVARANGHTPDRLALDRLFLSQSTRDRLEFAITGIEPCAVSGERDHNQARIALGEIADIGPKAPSAEAFPKLGRRMSTLAWILVVAIGASIAWLLLRLLLSYVVP
jgi:hypothetical protein